MIFIIFFLHEKKYINSRHQIKAVLAYSGFAWGLGIFTVVLDERRQNAG